MLPEGVVLGPSGMLVRVMRTKVRQGDFATLREFWEWTQQADDMDTVFMLMYCARDNSGKTMSETKWGAYILDDGEHVTIKVNGQDLVARLLGAISERSMALGRGSNPGKLPTEK